MKSSTTVMVARSHNAIINDVSIQIATVNGSGSQTANIMLMRAIFQMGIPVGAKNLLPSNVEGEPTWFAIRVNQDGYVGMKKEYDVLICLNPRSLSDDVKTLPPGAVVIYDAPLQADKLRNDLVYYEVPFTKLVATIPDIEPHIRKLLVNTCYVGVLAELLNLDMVEVESVINKQFKGKTKAIAANIQVARTGADYARTKLPKLERFRLERIDKTAGKIIIDGNTAVAIGCVMAGCTVMGWYPITPATGICEAFNTFARKYRLDPKTGKATYASVQAEDELASVGILIGAGWAGARAMTATSGPGLSLMAELVGLAYYVEVPIVIFDVQRVGPSTGLPTRTMQCDLISAAFLSHGDVQHILLLPGSTEECYEMAMQSFDLSERFQTPVMVLLDLDLGMNCWMTTPLPYPDPKKSPDRGKVLTSEYLEKLRQQGKTFERYRDVDGDGIPYRTLPGTNHPLSAYFTRGTGHNEQARYSEDPSVFTRNLDRLARKINTARTALPAPIRTGDPDAPVGLIAFGSTTAIMTEVMAQLEARGIKSEYLRLRGYPFSPAVTEFIKAKSRVYVVEQNRDGQMRQLLQLDIAPELGARLRSVLRYDGMPIDARSVSDEIIEREKTVSGEK
ncbi:MAG: 2-oxoacid:acceptor oxidoreductase subunit alpha [Planctomycetota bacterium]